MEDLCQRALEGFTKQDFESCMECLNRAANNAAVDSEKRDLNRALVVFAKSKWRNVDQYRSSLSRLMAEPKVFDDRKHSVVLYNLAVLHFHAGQYKSALSCLDRIDGSTSSYLTTTVHFLRIEIYLMLRQAERALTCIEDLEGTLRDDEEGQEDEKTTDLLHLFRARAYLTLKRHRAYKNHAKFLGFQPWKMFLCRAQAEYLSNPRSAIQLILEVQEVYPIDPLDVANAGNECRTLLVNNALGCVYGKLGKAHLATVYFNRAMSELVSKSSTRSLFAYSPQWRCCLLYNLGLALLQTAHCQHSNFQTAFDCFLAVLQVYHRNQRLWLRLAECCISAQNPIANIESALDTQQKTKRGPVRKVVGVGPHRKALLRSKLAYPETHEPLSGAGAIPVLSAEFAALCLRNALALQPRLDAGDLHAVVRHAESGREAVEGSFPLFQASPGDPFTVMEVHRLRCSTLCAAAFVSLTLGEYQLALEYAGRLQELPHVSSGHQLYWRLYGGEACVLLEDYKRAIDILDPTKINELKFGSDLAPPKTVACAKAIVICNLALAFTLQGDYQRAAEALNQIKNADNAADKPVQAIMLGLYLQIKTGQFEDPRRVVLQYLPPVQ